MCHIVRMDYIQYIFEMVTPIVFFIGKNVFFICFLKLFYRTGVGFAGVGLDGTSAALAGGNLSDASPPLLWLLAVIPGTLIAVAAGTAIPARIGTHRSVAEVLRAE